MSNILVRTLTGAVFISVILLPLFFSEIISDIVFGVFMLLTLIEFYQLFRTTDNVDVRWESGTFVGVLLFGLTAAVINDFISPDFFLMVIPVMFILAITELWRKKSNPLFNAAVSIFGIIYVAVPFIILMVVNHADDHGLPIVAGMFILIWMNDTFAYLSGRFFGKTKLIERISPNKTWEGTIGGILFTLLAGAALAFLFDQDRLLYWVLSAALIAPCAILGDLLESIFKRNANVKDSGNLLPGHGGVLDRFDATLFTVPFFVAWTYIYMYF